MPLTVFANPKIEVVDPASAGFWEGCLSVPGLRGFVERPQFVRVTYQDLKGKQHVLELTGFLATVFQHEFDHLDGVLYIDRINDTKKLVFEDEYLQNLGADETPTTRCSVAADPAQTFDETRTTIGLRDSEPLIHLHFDADVAVRRVPPPQRRRESVGVAAIRRIAAQREFRQRRASARRAMCGRTHSLGARDGSYSSAIPRASFAVEHRHERVRRDVNDARATCDCASSTCAITRARYGR